MPEFGGVVEVGHVLGAPTQAGASQRRGRLNIERENPFAVRASIEHQIYIYNTSPWPQPLTSGSTGSFYVPPLAEDKVLGDDLCVAGPCIVPGSPSETYPIDDGMTAKRMYHTPPEGLPDSEHPGRHFAKELLGARVMGANPHSDLTQQGVFISERRGYNPIPAIPEFSGMDARKQLAEWIRQMCSHYGIPGKNFDDMEEEARRVRSAAAKIYTAFRADAFYKDWQLMVKAAQQTFRGKCERMCAEANMAQQARAFHTVHEPRLFKAARYIGKTPVECPWMEHSGDSSGSNACWSCGTVSKAKFKCPQCQVLLVSQADWDAEVKRRAGGQAA